MTAFRFAILLSPFFIGVVLPFFLALRKTLVQRGIAAMAFLVGTLASLALWAGISGEFATFLRCAGYLAAFTLCTAGLFLFVAGLRAPAHVCQLVVCLVVCFVMGLPFLARSIVNEMSDPAAIPKFLDRAAQASPLIVLSHGIEFDIYNADSFYYEHRAPFAEYPTPKPGPAHVTPKLLALAGMLLLAAFLLHRIFR